MIVVTKRYYDYDYDNNTIIMFDAEDVGLTLDLDDTIYSLDEELSDKEDHDEMDKKQISNPAPAISHTAIQSESTDTVPDDTNIIAPNTPPDKMSGCASNDVVLSPTPPHNNSPKLKSSSSSSNGVSWISSESPKGSRHIPYALHIAHSYTISKLPVHLTHLVDKKQYLREKAEYEAKQAAIAAQQQQQQQQYNQYQYGQYMNNHNYQRYYHPRPPLNHHHHPQYVSPAQFHAQRHVTPPQPARKQGKYMLYHPGNGPK